MSSRKHILGSILLCLGCTSPPMKGGAVIDASPVPDVAATRGEEVGADAPADTIPPDAAPAGCAAEGSPCTTGDETCSSGDPIEIACRDIRICTGGRWRRSTTQLAACQAGRPTACPATPPDAGSACATHFQLCSYQGTSCACVTGCESGLDAGPCSKPLLWACPTSGGSGCPASAPQVGAACDGQAPACSYGPYCAQYYVVCEDGRWEVPPWIGIGGCG